MSYPYDEIRAWAVERNLIAGSTPKHQFVKLVEEFGELRAALRNGTRNDIIDAIGDCMVVITTMCAQGTRSVEAVREQFHPVPFQAHGKKKTKMPKMSMMEALGILASVLARFHPTQHGDEGSLRYAHAYRVLIEVLERTARKNCIGLDSCAILAYETIKDRKGRMVDGMFVKEGE